MVFLSFHPSRVRQHWLACEPLRAADYSPILLLLLRLILISRSLPQNRQRIRIRMKIRRRNERGNLWVYCRAAVAVKEWTSAKRTHKISLNHDDQRRHSHYHCDHAATTC